VRYAVDFAPAAARQFRRLPRSVQQRLGARVDTLASNPRPPGVQKLAGRDSLYRIRVGDYRVIYEISDAVLVVLILKVAHRRESYRRL
jgi:mRNA interferase RelE/StbE